MKSNKKLTKEYWNNRYDEKKTGWDIGYISTPLKEYFDQLSNKNMKILIPGCGNAYEAEYLFNQGFNNVFLIDFSELAFSQFTKRVPDFPKQHLICDDFFNHSATYDLIVEQTFFCALSPNLRPKYVEHTHQILHPKGKLVGLLFTFPLEGDSPPFGGNIKEYKSLFSKKYNIDTMKPCYNSISPRQGNEVFIKLYAYPSPYPKS